MSARARWGREGRVALAVAAMLAAAVGAGTMSPPGFDGGDARTSRIFAALGSAGLVAAAVLPFMLRRRSTARRVWTIAAGVALVAGAASFAVAGDAQRDCTARYGSGLVIVGSEYTPNGAAYAAANPHLSRDELLFDSAGAAERQWTRASIDRCRLRIRLTYFLWLPFLIVGVVASIQAVAPAAVPAVLGDAPMRPARADGGARYDAFLSYRHQGRDAEAAHHVLEALEGDGYTVAIDERDFAANASFLEELERCVRESRFTVAIVSPRYLESGNCQEEAIVCKVLDMDERRRRLIPFVIEPVAMPAWLYGLVGIDCTKADPLVDPIEKLKSTLGPPSAASRQPRSEH
jgi:hypothetical protein